MLVFSSQLFLVMNLSGPSFLAGDDVGDELGSTHPTVLCESDTQI